MFFSFNKLKWNAPLPAFVFTPSLLHPSSQLKENARWFGIVDTSYICCHTLVSFLLVCSQASAFFACRTVFCAIFLVDCITLQDLIFDSKSYCSSKSSKSLRSCGKLLSPFVVNDAAGTSVCCRIVTPLSLHFYSLREGSSTFRGYTASYIALKTWDWVMYRWGKDWRGQFHLAKWNFSPSPVLKISYPEGKEIQGKRLSKQLWNEMTTKSFVELGFLSFVSGQTNNLHPKNYF